MGVALALVTEAVLSTGSGTTCTPSIIVGAECAPETSSVEEDTDVGEPEDATAEAEELRLAEEMKCSMLRPSLD